MPNTATSPGDFRRQQHAEIKAEIDKRLVANADNFDKAILAYSSAGLGLSIGLLKGFVAPSQAHLLWLLYSSWALFIAAVTVTLASYLTSQIAQHRQLEISIKYNLEMKDEALEEINLPARITEWSSYVAALFFILALSSSALFVALNLP